MLTLREAGGGVTLQAPTWFGLLILGMGVVLLVYVVRGKARGKAFGAAVAGLVAVGYGWFLLYSQARFDDKGVVVRGALGVETAAGWEEIDGVSLEPRGGGRGGPTIHLVMQRSSGSEIQVRVAGLDADARVRLLEHARKRSSRASGS